MLTIFNGKTISNPLINLRDISSENLEQLKRDLGLITGESITDITNNKDDLLTNFFYLYPNADRSKFKLFNDLDYGLSIYWTHNRRFIINEKDLSIKQFSDDLNENTRLKLLRDLHVGY